MNVYLNIQKLITYAKIHLLLDEADEIYVRNILMQKLRLNSYEVYEVDEDEIERCDSPYEIIDELFAYALDKGICKEEAKRLFTADLMDVVSLRPGEMEDTFESLSKNMHKALEFVFDYAVKNGSAITRFQRWENKGDYNLEVVFADNIVSKSPYPGCADCIEGEGYGIHRNERYVAVPGLDGYYYKAAKLAYHYGMGKLVAEEHRPLIVDDKTLDAMFDFVEMAPSMYICTGECEETANHAHFICGCELLPIHSAAENCKHKNKDYPYINIAEVNWYLSTLKLSCTNREKLAEFAMKLINKFKAEEKGKIFVSLRKVDSKFVFDIAFIKGAPKKEHGALCSLDVCAMAGLFRIGSEVRADLKEMEKYLTKEAQVTLAGGMEAYSKMIEALLKSAGTAKLGAVEAALDVKEECKKNLAAFLTDISAYSSGMAELVM